jgi:phosphatidylserine synthase 2
VWRFVTGLSILYLLGLIFLFFQVVSLLPTNQTTFETDNTFQTVDFARQFLKYFDSDLGVPLPERSYAEHCEIYTPDHPHSSFANVLVGTWLQFPKKQNKTKQKLKIT